MLTKIIIRNFKKFEDVEIELSNSVVFIGPNNSGKTTALQALALWNLGVKRWHEKQKGKQTDAKLRIGVPVNRRDLITVPAPNAKLLWRDLHVRDIRKSNGKQETQNIRMDIIAEGITNSKIWSCGLEFDYANEESFHCRPLRLTEDKAPDRMPVPNEATEINVAFLPPMSGLDSNEALINQDRINFLIGQGRTAEVLRNLCYQLVQDKRADWEKVVNEIDKLFGLKLSEPEYVPERGEIVMSYQDKSSISLDLSSSGRGLQQTLLLLSYMAVNPNSVLLLDEPDAHLEILRQRQTYEVINRFGREWNSQIIAASHSEVILNEAADRDVVVAFVGKPHRIDDRAKNQVSKSLKEIGFEQYYQAEQKGWVLYLEGSTDLAVLKAFAEKLDHPAKDVLERPFVYYMGNALPSARSHFYALREAKTDLVGYLLCDRIESSLDSRPEKMERMWQRREIENYLSQPETLKAFARNAAYERSGLPLIDTAEELKRERLMQECIENRAVPAALQNPNDSWWVDTKMSDDFLDKVFPEFLEKLGLPPNLMRKSDYHQLASFVPMGLIADEITEVLDDIVEVSKNAREVAD
jgi:energy-coupling factor transporter ATP-binding protein EcfA2